jgi:hypothetical protein
MGSRGFSERERDFSWLRKEGSRVIVDLGLLSFLVKGMVWRKEGGGDLFRVF